jgi:DNA processing protein
MIVVSGLAYGIDIAAHKAALAHNLQTIGVLGPRIPDYLPFCAQIHGRCNAKERRIASLISSPHTAGKKQFFIKRNRIYCRLSDATLVIESGLKGGALITSDIANSYNRDRFRCSPEDRMTSGRPEATTYKKEQGLPCRIGGDITYLLGWEPEKPAKAVQTTLFL